YHAAAYKHVNLMEGNVAACFKNNVFGTANVVEAAIAHQCGHFILISTDKAVKPTSTMGLSKRLAEETVLTMPPCQTRLLAVRFGNVLGSSGSVIPIFKEQIRQGGPVTVTSPDATRFFMTIPEAVQLVMLAGTVGDDRKVMILEMGEPVKIIDLAKRLIELSGFKPEVEIPIEFSGLGHGEKVFEELMTESEEVRKTPYDKIYVLCDEEKVTAAFSRLQLEDLLSNGDSERHLNEAEKLKRQFAR
ncbi:MAG: polysaccharide biosynthesis protein, partial [Verrucomicrobiota bacterium]